MANDLLERPTSAPASRDMVDDVTRRRFIVGAGAVLFLAACGDTPEGAEAPAGGGPADRSTCTIEHFAGTSEVPVDPSGS